MGNIEPFEDMSTMEFGEVDKLLNDVEPVLIQLAGKYLVRQPTIERWHWDEPDLTLSWIGLDGIHRNIHAIVENGLTSILVEVNAWRDEDMEEAKTRVRRWWNTDIGVIRISDRRYLKAEDLNKTIDIAFQTVVSWDKGNLKYQTFISQSLMVR
jgi:hypothetical protein